MTLEEPKKGSLSAWQGSVKLHIRLLLPVRPTSSKSFRQRMLQRGTFTTPSKRLSLDLCAHGDLPSVWPFRNWASMWAPGKPLIGACRTDQNRHRIHPSC